jgi:formimidoylglutamate deiminase
VPGARADLLVVDTRESSLLGMPPEQLLDALVFSSPARPWRDVMVAGRFVVREHRQAPAEGIAQRFAAAMHALWQEPR